MKRIILPAVLIALSGCTQFGYDKKTPAYSDSAHTAPQQAACIGFGPQTPRDITQRHGTNPVTFPVAPQPAKMNLCNIHFHNGAEHKSPAFSVEKIADNHGHRGGYQCGISTGLSPLEMRDFPGNACTDVAPGDTIEVHWVHTSCAVSPGPGLGACLSDKCANPSLRVETQVYTVVNDPAALNFAELTTLVKRNGLNQAKLLPTGTGSPIEFLGSTTGPKYSEAVCSPLQVTWSVRPACAKVSIASLSAWCENNVFNENHGHGIRELVTNPALLSPIDSR